MRILKESFLKAQADRYPRATEPLASWIRSVRAAQWKSFAEVRQTMPGVDQVKVKSGHTVYVFNIRRNEFRLIAAIHFDAKRLFT